MSEEEQTPGQDGEQTPDESEKDAKIKTLEDQNSNLVNEVRDERKKKQDAQAERDVALADKKPAPTIDSEESDVDVARKAVDLVLGERDKEVAQINRANAETAFKNARKEFHPENDIGEVKYTAFQNTLSRINLSGLKTQAEFMSAFEDAYRLMGNYPSNEQDNASNPYESTPSGGNSIPKVGDEDQLQDIEIRAMKKFGWTREQYLKQRKSKPAYIESILKYVK